MGLGGGHADRLVLGDWNIYCSMCGRKMKAGESVRNWQGMYRHSYHDEPRQPQDFARGVAEHMEVPFAQPLADNNFVSIPATFPLTLSPSPLILPIVDLDLLTESSLVILTEAGVDLTTEDQYIGWAMALTPGWITPATYAWSWVSGGANITIDDPTMQMTFFQTAINPSSGVVQCTVTDIRGAVGTALLTVST